MLLATLLFICLARQASPSSSTHPSFLNHRPAAFIFAQRIDRYKWQQMRNFYVPIQKAIIFYPDGDDGPTFEDDFLSSASDAVHQDQQEQMILKLSNPSYQRLLAHVVSAFPPAGHVIDLSYIHQIRCAHLDNKHVEIEAVVCDESECTSLLVPVAFPKECDWNDDNSSSFEDCVMQNIQILDQEGERIFEQNALFKHKDEAQLAYKILQSAISDKSLKDAHSITYPEWWVFPRNDEEISECNLLQELLNGDDMYDTRLDLMRHAQVNQSDECEVKEVKVMAIGPMGIVLQMRFANESNKKEGEAIPIKFLADTSSIREEVLKLVSSVNAE